MKNISFEGELISKMLCSKHIPRNQYNFFLLKTFFLESKSHKKYGNLLQYKCRHPVYTNRYKLKLIKCTIPGQQSGSERVQTFILEV